MKTDGKPVILILSEIIKIVATSCQILRLKCIKFYSIGWGSTPYPAGGAPSAPPDPLLDLKGPTSKRIEEGGKMRGVEGKRERRGRRNGAEKGAGGEEKKGEGYGGGREGKERKEGADGEGRGSEGNEGEGRRDGREVKRREGTGKGPQSKKSDPTSSDGWVRAPIFFVCSKFLRG